MGNKNKTCLLCQQLLSKEVDSLSPTKGTMALSNPTKNVLIISSDKEELLFSIKYCPMCGAEVDS